MPSERLRTELPVLPYNADAILERMRDDEESDWPRRLAEALVAHELRGGRGLSGQETKVLLCLSHGLSLSETADVLGIGYGTVREYLGWARRKLRGKTTAHTVALALRAGLIA